MRFAALLLALIALSAPLAAPTPVSAQEDVPGASYITPFPNNDIYQLYVIGDYMADGLLDALIETLGDDTRLQIERRHHSFSGLMRPDVEEELRDLEAELQSNPRHIVVLMFGVQDRVSLRLPNGRRLPVGSEEWRAEYARRADRLLKMLKRRNLAVYWVGLPILRRQETNEDAQMINEVVRERVYLNGLKYIDSYSGFSDETGSFSPYGPDLTGKIRLLREGDGVNFTDAGNRKLAHFVEKELKRDLTQAKNDRSVPLAGNEAEQARINPGKIEDPSKTAGASPRSAESKAAKPLPAIAGVPAATFDATGDLKADPGRISLKTVSASGREEIVTLEIVRPAIPSSVVALVTRRESPDKLSPMGDALVEQIGSGLTVMSSITPADSGTGAARRKLSPTQAPFYRVLVKGERVPPRPGRADDVSWPRLEASAQPPASAPAAPPSANAAKGSPPQAESKTKQPQR